ncbi:hypothetical protein NDU88_004595 [Pleurodeles waltl]|uniref:Uncharacterized protein n=1 Tax=Pleurodeles waltl TaxID=8319 RepID=A0AAV7LIJ0_PLEWA|nr:hypothetical protein NDU88_004595 [Pleurodeles waltl]
MPPRHSSESPMPGGEAGPRPREEDSPAAPTRLQRRPWRRKKSHRLGQWSRVPIFHGSVIMVASEQGWS